MLLNFIYLVHGASALAFALLLLFMPDWFSQMIMGIPWVQGDMADAATVHARFAAVGLAVVVSATSFARQSSSSRVRWAAILSLMVVLLLAVLVAALTIPFYRLKVLAIAGNAILLLAYLYVRIFESDSIGLPPPITPPDPASGRALNFIFLVHAVLALVLALLLLLLPVWFSQTVMGIPWVPGQMADAATVYARFAAVGLVLVVLVIARARRSPSTRVRRAAAVSMAILSLLGLLVALKIPFYLLMILALLGNAIFLLLYGWILFFKTEQL